MGGVDGVDDGDAAGVSGPDSGSRLRWKNLNTSITHRVSTERAGEGPFFEEERKEGSRHFLGDLSSDGSGGVQGEGKVIGTTFKHLESKSPTECPRSGQAILICDSISPECGV